MLAYDDSTTHSLASSHLSIFDVINLIVMPNKNVSLSPAANMVAGPGSQSSPDENRMEFPAEIAAATFDANEFDVDIHHDSLVMNFGHGLVGVRLGPTMHRELSDYAEEGYLILSSDNTTAVAEVDRKYEEATKLGKGFTAKMRAELINRIFGDFPEFLAHQVPRPEQSKGRFEILAPSPRKRSSPTEEETERQQEEVQLPIEPPEKAPHPESFDVNSLVITRRTAPNDTATFEGSMEQNAHDEVFHFAKEDYDVLTDHKPVEDLEVRKTLRMLSFDPKVLSEKDDAYETMESFDRFVRNLAPFRKRALNKGLTEELILEEVLAEHVDFRLRDKINREASNRGRTIRRVSDMVNLLELVFAGSADALGSDHLRDWSPDRTLTAEQNVEALKRRLRLSRNVNVRAVINVLMGRIPPGSPTHVELVRRIQKSQRKNAPITLTELFGVFINAEKNFGCCSKTATQITTKVNVVEATEATAIVHETESRPSTQDTTLLNQYGREDYDRRTNNRQRTWNPRPQRRYKERHVRKPPAERYFKEEGHCKNCGVAHKGPCLFAFPRCKVCFKIHDPKEDCPSRNTN